MIQSNLLQEKTDGPLSKPTNAQNTLLVIKDKMPFFQDLSNEELLGITTDVRFEKLEPGAVVFEQGDTGTEIFYVVDGQVDIMIAQESGEYVTVAHLGKKELFGEMSFITHEPRSARAVAAENEESPETKLLVFSVVDEADDATIYALSNVYFKFSQLLADRLRATNKMFLSQKSAGSLDADALAAVIAHEEEPVYPKEGDDQVYILPDPLYSKLVGMLQEAKHIEDKKAVLKEAIVKALELGEKDAVLFAKDRAVIRLFKGGGEASPPGAAPAAAAPAEEASQGRDEVLPGEAGEYMETIFGSRRDFEKEVLQVTAKEEREEYARAMFEDMLENGKAKTMLSFCHMESYNQLNLRAIVAGFLSGIWEQIAYFLGEECGLEPEDVDQVVKNPRYREFVQNVATHYIAEYGKLAKEAIADSFFMMVGKAPNMTSVAPVIQEAINGTRKYRSVFFDNGRRVASKDEQVWVRVNQAQLEREKRSARVREETERTRRLVAGLEKNVEAFKKAKKIKVEKLQKYSFSDLRDIVVKDEDEGGKDRTEEKRLLQYLPSGDGTLFLMELANKGFRSARNDIQKEEFERTLKYFSILHSNNTPATLQIKWKELMEELPKKQASLERQENRLAEMEAVGLENFDETLALFKKVIIRNLGKPPV